MSFLTISKLIALPFFFLSLGFFIGAAFYSGEKQYHQKNVSFIRIDESAPLVQIDGQDLSFKDLSAEAQLEIYQQVLNLSDVVRGNAKRRAALVSINQGQSWTEALRHMISEEQIKSTYEALPSLHSLGALTEVKWEAERYIIKRERSLLAEKFYKEQVNAGKMRFPSVTLPSVKFEAEVDDFPLVALGDVSGTHVDLAVILQYAGLSHKNQLTALDQHGKSIGVRFNLRVVSEYTHHPYNETATKALLCARKLKLTGEKVIQLHDLIVQMAPRSLWANKSSGEEVALAAKLNDVAPSLSHCDVSKEVLEKVRGMSREISRVRSNKEPLYVIGSSLHTEHGIILGSSVSYKNRSLFAD